MPEIKGQVVEGMDHIIGTQLVSFYHNLYREQFDERLKLKGLDFSTITEEDASWRLA